MSVCQNVSPWSAQIIDELRPDYDVHLSNNKGDLYFLQKEIILASIRYWHH